MGYMYQGDAVINASLTVESPKPLDTRTVVEDIENLYSIPESSAYRGMTVANINDGNLYMLIDKTKIKEKAGWKASYESIQIITCTQEEYDTWSDNTTEDYKPIDENLTYLRRDVYYYIYEDDEKSQYYVTKKQIEDWLKVKASAEDLSSLNKWTNDKFVEQQKSIDDVNTSIETLLNNLNTNYSTSEQIKSKYATIEALSTVDGKFTNYYTKEGANDVFVTKEALGGDLEGLEGESFVFVTSKKYDEDRESDSKKFSTSELLLGESSITTNATTLLVNGKEIAFKEIVPKIIMISGADYEALVENNQTDSETYYYTYDDDIVGYITHDAAISTFYTKGQINDMIVEAKRDLIDNYIVPLQNELAALKGS